MHPFTSREVMVVYHSSVNWPSSSSSFISLRPKGIMCPEVYRAHVNFIWANLVSSFWGNLKAFWKMWLNFGLPQMSEIHAILRRFNCNDFRIHDEVTLVSITLTEADTPVLLGVGRFYTAACNLLDSCAPQPSSEFSHELYYYAYWVSILIAHKACSLI